MRQAEASQRVVLGPVASALPRNVLGMGNLGCQLKPSESATLSWGLSSLLVFIRTPGHSVYTNVWQTLRQSVAISISDKLTGLNLSHLSKSLNQQD